jgi:queuine tRNA-ribosyltransferase
MKFDIRTIDGGARRGTLTLPRGVVETPAFMPVGTAGAVRSVSPLEVRESKSEIILGNTFHLMLRPGSDVIRLHGDLHKFMGWDGPILTDSGGFQVWSLADRRKIDEAGVTFRSPVNGAQVFLGPEESIRVQHELGSDIAMVFDECTPYTATRDESEASMRRSLRWAARCRRSHTHREQALFGIIQGGMHLDFRQEALRELIEMGFDGYAVGGLSVGEPKKQMYEVLDGITPEMPPDRPRYLMGVGKPQDLVRGVLAGIDMFDCVLPTRNGRNGWLYTRDGVVKIRHARYRTDTRPIEDNCSCPACVRFSRAYLRHLFVTGEILGMRLCTLHNLHFFQRLMADMRIAIEMKRLYSFSRAFIEDNDPGA